MSWDLSVFFEPENIVVIGASSRPNSLGYKLLDNLISGGFKGPVYPINPKARAVHSVRAYGSVRQLPECPDLALLIVPKHAAVASAKEALEAGARGLVVVTAGFRESGAEGAEAEAKLVELSKAYGVPMLGPNCMGVTNADPEVSMDASFSPVPPKWGPVAFASQSGALGVAILERLKLRGLGFGKFVSLGNCAMLDAADFVAHWTNEESIKCVALYLETLGNARKMVKAISSCSMHKPVVVLKGGASEQGARAAASHTGALAAGDELVTGILAKAGACRARSVTRFLDLAEYFQHFGEVLGNRVGILTNAGGPGILVADSLAEHGFSVPELPESIQESLRSFLPAEASVKNPVDTLPPGGPEEFARCLREMARAELDAMVVVVVTPVLATPQAVFRAVAETAAGLGRPVVTVFMTSPESLAKIASEQNHRVPCYWDPEAPAEVLEAARRWGLWKGIDREVVELKTKPGCSAREDGWVPLPALMSELSKAGVPVAKSVEAKSPSELAALVAEEQLNFPVVIKADAEGLIHKTEHAAVKVGIRNKIELEQQAAAMADRLSSAGFKDVVLVAQEQVSGVEMVVGFLRDPAAGPTVMVGTGGVAVEVFKDVVFRPAPVSASEAMEMITSLKGARMLEGFRGQPKADVESLAELVSLISRLGDSWDDLMELDLNPVLVSEKGAAVVDARARLATS